MIYIVGLLDAKNQKNLIFRVTDRDRAGYIEITCDATRLRQRRRSKNEYVEGIVSTLNRIIFMEDAI